jgi:cell filamentation protein
MRNNYQYVDPDYSYTDPQTGVLRNKENITDNQLLTIFESVKSSERLEELEKNPVKINNSKALLEIHKYLFQDIFDWAGQERTVEISKDGNQFFPLNHFNTAFLHIDELIAEYRNTNKSDKEKIARKLAEILDNVNYLHPFREGNGRTQREFIRVLALEKGYTLKRRIMILI